MRTKRTDVTLIEHERSGLVTAQVTDTSRAPAKRVQQLTNHQQQRYTHTHTHTHTHNTNHAYKMESADGPQTAGLNVI